MKLPNVTESYLLIRENIIYLSKMQAPRLPPFPVLREILKTYKLGALKKLSQNFLLDMNLTDKIVNKAGLLTDTYVVEVGPGPGGITRSILNKCPQKLIVVEKDRRFKPALEMLQEAYYDSIKRDMEIIYEDVLSLNMEKFFPEVVKKEWEGDRPPVTIIGNLPFSISTPLIIKWLKAISEQSNAWVFGRTRMTLTFQKEVAERLTAPENHVQRCRLSVMAQAWTRPIVNFYIPGEAFVPKPKVDVGVVTFIPLKKPLTEHEFSFFEKVTRHVFSFRQKYTKTCLQTLFPPDYKWEFSSKMLEMAELPSTVRAPNLTVQDIDKLATAYKYFLEKYPEIGQYNYRASSRLLPRNSTTNIQIKDYKETECYSTA